MTDTNTNTQDNAAAMWWHEMDAKWFRCDGAVNYVTLECRNIIGNSGDINIDVADLTDEQAAAVAEKVRLQFLENVQRRRKARGVQQKRPAQ